MKNREIHNLIKNNDYIYVLTHALPDGDAIGSALAWGAALRCLGKKVRVFCPGVIPHKYSFLPGAKEIENNFPDAPPEGVVFVLDCGDLERLEYMAGKVRQAGAIVNIDHHLTNSYFGDYNLVDTNAAATGEMIYRLIRENRLILDEGISLCLYVAIASDTGSFKYGNTTPRSLQIAAVLLQKGVDPSMVSRKIFDEYPLSTIYLLRDALASLQLDKSQKIAWMSLHENVLDLYGARSEEMEGFVNYGRNIYGVEVSIFFYHKRDKKTKVGFRSNTVDVGAIAAQFGGGGHARAAGCTLSEVDEHTAREKVIQAVKEMIEKREELKTP